MIKTKFFKLSIGVIGLSEGKDIATTLALEGIGSTYFLMEGLPCFPMTSASALQYEETNSVLTARALYEIDPFMDITVYTPHDVDVFFNNKMDVIFEQCNSVPFKVSSYLFLCKSFRIDYFLKNRF